MPKGRYYTIYICEECGDDFPCFFFKKKFKQRGGSDGHIPLECGRSHKPKWFTSDLDEMFF